MGALVAALSRLTGSHASGSGPHIWQDPHRDRGADRCAAPLHRMNMSHVIVEWCQRLSSRPQSGRVVGDSR